MTGPAALVIGVGNTLRGDDGVGQDVAQLLWMQRDRVPGLRNAQFVFVQQLAPELAFDLSEASVALFIDAACDAKPAGSVTVTKLSLRREAAAGEDQATVSRGFPAVGAGCWEEPTPDDLVAMAVYLYGRSPPAMLLTVSAIDLGMGHGRSPLVSAAVPVAVMAADVALEEMLGVLECSAAKVRSRLAGSAQGA